MSDTRIREAAALFKNGNALVTEYAEEGPLLAAQDYNYLAAVKMFAAATITYLELLEDKCPANS